MTLTPEARAALRVLCEAATPGPWHVRYEMCECGGDYGCSHSDYPYQLLAPTKQITRHAGSPFERREAAQLANFIEVEDATTADAEFIAAARTAVPALLQMLDDTERDCDQRIVAVQQGIAAWREAAEIEHNARLAVEADLAAAIARAEAAEQENERLRGLLGKCASALDYMEDRGYSSFRHLRSEVAALAAADGGEP